MTPDQTGITTPDLSTLMDGLSGNPLLFAVLAGIALFIAGRAAVNGRKAPTDPTRMFSKAQRAEGFGRAGSRCEMEGAWFRRCRRTAAHGDHWFPWSKGGATSMGNFVAACQRCNTSKGAKVPSVFATFRLVNRRRKYFPAGLDAATGQKFAQR